MNDLIDVYRTRTKKIFQEIILDLALQGYRWADGEPLRFEGYSQLWDGYKSNTCISTHKDFYVRIGTLEEYILVHDVKIFKAY